MNETNETNDNVKHPSHYTSGGIECIEAIKESMCTIAYKGYLKGNVMKYMWRYEDKNGLEDLEKARVYLDWLIILIEEEERELNEVGSESQIMEQIRKDIERAEKGGDGI